MSVSPDDSRSVCPRHHASPLLTHCGDCGVGMCDVCAIEIPSFGALCWECAARRGGLHRRPRQKRGGGPPVEPAPEPLVRSGGAVSTNPAVARFEALVDERGADPAGGQLSRRLEAVGVDPGEAVCDDDALLDELVRLQDLAADGEHRPQHWWQRR